MVHAHIYSSLETYLEANQSHYFDLLQQLVAMNSFTANKAGVNAQGELTADIFANLGFQAETIQSAHPDFGRHLILTRPGQSGRKVGFISHLDTVFPPEEEIRNNFTWREEGDRIYGPGTVDIKGGTVLMYMMLDALQAIVPEIYDDVTWVLLFDASEEVDGDDFSQLCLRHLEAEETLACLVFEGGRTQNGESKIVVARKGMAVYHLMVEGKAAHAGSAHKNGANAIDQLVTAIQKINGLTDYSRGLTVNMGSLQGGTVSNRVPHYASAIGEMRAFAPDVYDDALAHIKAVHGLSTVKSANGGYACRVNVEISRKTGPWPRNEATDRLFACWQDAAETLGVRVIPEERGGLSDGNYIWDKLPVIDGMGPTGANAHCSEHSADGSKEQEYCLRSSFVPKALLNVTAVLKLVAGG